MVAAFFTEQRPYSQADPYVLSASDARVPAARTRDTMHGKGPVYFVTETDGPRSFFSP